MRLGRLAPTLALGVAGVGLVVVVLGALRATAWAPPSQVATHASAKGPVVVTAPAVLAAGQGTVRVTARSTQGAVFLGVARAADVQAWLGDVARAEVTADADHPDVAATQTSGSATIADPRDSDIWVAEAGGAATAVLTWPDAPGQWRLVAAVDGRTAAPDVDIAWPDRSRTSNAPALIAVGAALLIAGVVGLAVLRRRPSGPARPAAATDGARVRGRRAAPAGTATARPARDRGAPGRHATPATGILRPVPSGSSLPPGSGSASVPPSQPMGVTRDGVLDNRVVIAPPQPLRGDGRDDADDPDDPDDVDEPVVRPFRQTPRDGGFA